MAYAELPGLPGRDPDDEAMKTVGVLSGFTGLLGTFTWFLHRRDRVPIDVEEMERILKQLEHQAELGCQLLDVPMHLYDHFMTGAATFLETHQRNEWTDHTTERLYVFVEEMNSFMIEDARRVLEAEKLDTR